MLSKTRVLALITVSLAFGCQTEGVGSSSGFVSCYDTPSGVICVETQDVTGEDADADGDGIDDHFMCGDTDSDGDHVPDAHEEETLSLVCGEWACHETDAGGLACRQECENGVVCEKGCEIVEGNEVCGEPVCTDPEPAPAPDCSEWVCEEHEGVTACRKECENGVVCEKTCEVVEEELVCGEKVCTEPGGEEGGGEEGGGEEGGGEEGGGAGDKDGDGIDDSMDCGEKD